MNDVINLPRLIAAVAKSAGVTPAVARKFIHELFARVESSLVSGQSVTIRGVGEFFPGDDPENPVLFRPDADLAALANEPFAMFEAAELNDGAAEAIRAAEGKPVVEAEPKPEPEPEPEPEVVELEPEPEAKSEIKPEPQENQDNLASLDFRDNQDNPENLERQDQMMPQTPAQRPVIWLVLGILIGILIGLVGGYFAGKAMASYQLPDMEDYELTEEIEQPEKELVTEDPASTPVEGVVAENPQPTEPQVSEPAPAQEAAKAKEPVYDTVTGKRYLSVLAREHYGVKNYWIFIYQANPQLGNPNKINPGTRVLIPDKESFMEPTKAETDAKAQRLLNELHKKYNF